MFQVPLAHMAHTTNTVLWNDSADPAELAESIGYGAVGATCNPVIALAALRAQPSVWAERIAAIAAAAPCATESEVGWQAVMDLSVAAAELLEPAFAEHGGRNGRLSIQTDPRLHRNAAALVTQAVAFAELAPNIIVKIPATATGITAMEEATFRGVSVNATVSFTVAQALSAAEAIERGLRRRAAAGYDITTMGPVVTLMVGRLDDWLKKWSAGTVPDEVLDWAGIAVFKYAYQLFCQRGYTARLLSAAFRHLGHWSELIGGDVVISPPLAWQRKANASTIPVRPRISDPVPVLDELLALPEFRRAYDLDGMTPDEFAGFGASRATLRQFLAADADLDALVRDVLIREP